MARPDDEDYDIYVATPGKGVFLTDKYQGQDAVTAEGMEMVKAVLAQQEGSPVMPSVEAAIRRTVVEGQTFRTPARGSEFSVAKLGPDHLVLLLGKKEAWTPISWKCLEGIPEFLADRGWVVIGSVYETSADPDTLDGYLKGCLKRATAGWVAAVLENAGVVEIDRGRPARVRLSADFSGQSRASLS